MLTQICFHYWTAFGFWSKVLTVMILNISVVNITYNLRAILLFESDFNFLNKLYFVISLMKIAGNSGVLPQAQHVGRSGYKKLR